MKAAWQFKQEWEQENFIRLVNLSDKTLNAFHQFLKQFRLILSLIFFISYKIADITLAIVLVSLATETSLRCKRDEEWIFRQIK